MNLAVAVVLAFIAGAITATACFRVLWRLPLSRLDALERRIDELLRKRNPN